MSEPSAKYYSELRSYAREWGLSWKAANAYATLGWWGMFYGLQPPAIISGKRSRRKQRQMQRAWDRGDRQGLAVRPADSSTHTTGDGWDVERVSHIHVYGAWAPYAGARWGGTFRTPDPIHFDVRG